MQLQLHLFSLYHITNHFVIHELCKHIIPLLQRKDKAFSLILKLRVIQKLFRIQLFTNDKNNKLRYTGYRCL